MTARHYLLGLMILLLLSGCAGLLPEVSPKPSQNEGVLALLNQAEQDISAGQWPEAGASLERALRIEPRNPVLWQRLAKVRMEQGEYSRAENLAAKSNALAPENRRLRAENWRIIGESRQARGDQSGAEEAFSRMTSGR